MADEEADKVFDEMDDMEVDSVADMEMEKMASIMADMEVDHVTDMVADMVSAEVDKVADMEVDKMVDIGWTRWKPHGDFFGFLSDFFLDFLVIFFSL